MGPGTANLVLKAACEACGKAADLYGTACRHATVCSSCGKAMALARTPCAVCAAPVTNLIRVQPAPPATALAS
jgi:transcription initiation factor TFIIF subunit alpha